MLYYSNKEDPRTYVYKAENILWGVTLNFAHKKARLLMIAILLFLMTPTLLLVIARCAGVSSGSANFLFEVCMAAIALSVAVTLYIGAARDLKKHPGLKGPRERNMAAG